MKRIKVISPIVTGGIRSLGDLRALEHEGLRIEHTLIDEGPSSIESMYEEMLAAPGIALQALRAQAEGCDAVVVDCFGDPGVQVARELLDIPVFGPGECSMHMAAMLGRRFSIVTVLPSVLGMISELVERCGLTGKLASIRVIDIPVLALHGDMSKLQQAMGEAACKAVAEDGAEVTVLGCTGFLGCAGSVNERLESAGLAVPVIDPIPLAVGMAVTACDAGLSHSKRAWAAPGRKHVGGFAALETARG